MKLILWMRWLLSRSATLNPINHFIPLFENGRNDWLMDEWAVCGPKRIENGKEMKILIWISLEWTMKRGGKWENWAAFLLFWLWVMSAERHRQQAKREDQPQLISSAEPEGNKPITKRKQRESTALFGLSFGWLWPLALLQRTNTPQLIHYSLINCCCGARPLREKKTSPRSSTTTKERAPNPHSFVGLWVKS